MQRYTKMMIESRKKCSYRALNLVSTQVEDRHVRELRNAIWNGASEPEELASACE